MGNDYVTTPEITFLRNGTMEKTWLDREEVAYSPCGAMLRRGRVLCEDGQVRAVRAGIPSTFFSIPAYVRYKGRYVAGIVTAPTLEQRNAGVPDDTICFTEYRNGKNIIPR